MKSLLLKIFLFGCVFTATLTILNFIFKRAIQPYDYYRLHFTEIKKPEIYADGIILGNSKSLHGIQASILSGLHLPFYNFSLNGATANYYLLWYKNIFKPVYKKPKVVILSVDFAFVDNADYRRQFEQDSEYFSDSTFLRLLFCSEEINKLMFLKNRFPGTKNLSSFNLLFKKRYSPYVLSKFKAGYIPYEPLNKDIYDTPQDYVLSTYQTAKFEELLRELLHDNIRVVLLQTPEYIFNQEKYYSSPSAKYFDSIATAFKLPYLNYNTGKLSSFNSNKTYFSDQLHLNDSGSYVFSTMLVQDLKEILNVKN